ncbi:hypothetical protein GGS21DRAFT_488539 [Xylaria nigripes]|nr:hypothetical protein GGS21DRAFT_488539 [Xylaria nigripes]
MSSGKGSLYVALYARGGAPTMPGLEDTYHWALLVEPEIESDKSQGHRFHVKELITLRGNPPVPHIIWRYEKLAISMAPTSMLLVRIMIGKVRSMSRLHSILEHTPVRPDIPRWNCVQWVREALLSAIQDGKALRVSVSDWESVRDLAMWYVETKKAAHRFDGISQHNLGHVATWDMLHGIELAP